MAPPPGKPLPARGPPPGPLCLEKEGKRIFPNSFLYFYALYFMLFFFCRSSLPRRAQQAHARSLRGAEMSDLRCWGNQPHLAPLLLPPSFISLLFLQALLVNLQERKGKKNCVLPTNDNQIPMAWQLSKKRLYRLGAAGQAS